MIKITIPATSANVGSGFDSIGFALALYNTFYFEFSDATSITGCDTKYAGLDNLAYQAAAFTFKKLNFAFKGLKIHFESNIPVSRGLGSSSTCVLAGVLAADHLAKANLSKAQILEIAMTFEGHPDNLAPALYGGFTVSAIQNEKVITEKIELAKSINCVAFIPNYELPTEKARRALPHSLNYKDATFNISRAALLIAMLQNGHLEHLNIACDDRLHQPYRGKLIPDYNIVFNCAQSAGAKAVYLSGAGPTIIAIIKDTRQFLKNISLNTTTDWRILPLNLDHVGAKVKE